MLCQISYIQEKLEVKMVNSFLYINDFTEQHVLDQTVKSESKFKTPYKCTAFLFKHFIFLA